MSITQHFQVKLEPQYRGDGSFNLSSVVFNTTPEVTENRNINYKTLEPVHAPGTVLAYNNTSTRTFSVSNIKLISRTSDEATINLRKVNLLRSWGMPHFGQSPERNVTERTNIVAVQPEQNNNETTAANLRSTRSLQRFDASRSAGSALQLDKRALGAPPAILLLSAYSSPTKRGNIYKVPVVIQNLTIPYPSDVDYIPTNNGTPFPTIMSVELQLAEVHSPLEYERFNLQQFKEGILEGF
jgi:hypothetical protein